MEIITLSSFFFAIMINVVTSSHLETYNIDRNAISVSGISPGGNMAVQLHISHSKLFMGVGVLAAGPYWCAQNNMMTATNACMLWPNLINVKYLQLITRNAAFTGYADPVINLWNDRVFLYNGNSDTVVDTGVVKATQKYYSEFVKPTNIKTEFSLPAQHGFPTLKRGGPCDKLNPDFINNCGYDVTYEVLSHIYGRLKSPSYVSTSPLSGSVVQFDQTDFFAGFFFFDIGLANQGFLFVPDSCKSGVKACRLHVALHGCFQGSEFIQDGFVNDTGYNEVAALNDIIVLYPQIKKNLASNPTGCFDWWGYTGSDYASNIGDQIVAIRKMIGRIANV